MTLSLLERRTTAALAQVHDPNVVGSADALRLAGQMRWRPDPFGEFQPRRAPRIPGADFGIRAHFTGDRPLVPRSAQGHRRPRPGFTDGRDVLQVPLPRTGQFPGHRFEATIPVAQPAMTIADIPDEAYTLIAQADGPDELRTVRPPISSLSEGRLGRTVIDSPFFAPVGPLADLAGTETVWRTFFAPEGIEIIDVRGRGLTAAVVDWRVADTTSMSQGGAQMSAVFIPIIAVLGAIALAAAATGWAIRQIRVLVFGEEGGGGLGGAAVFGLLALLGIAAVGALGGRRTRGGA